MNPTRLALLAVLTLAATARGDDRARRAKAWEAEYKAVAARRARESPPADAPVLLGSSSFRLWDTAKALPELRPFNAGFGGSQVRDTTHALDRLLADAKPRYALVYAGDNDIAAGRSPEAVRDDSAELVAALRRKFPGLPVLFVAIKPSASRTGQLPKQREANRLLREFCASEPGLLFLDVVPGMVDASGKPRAELYRADRLHLSAAGYEVWARLLRAALATWPPRAKG